MPTMTLETTGITPSQLVNGYTLNVTGCTSNVTTDCVITSNATSETIINPVRSARITTKGKKSITYGRVEVLAKMPAGDWLWPAIWYVTDDTTQTFTPCYPFPFSLTIHNLQIPLTHYFLCQDDA